jgi:chromosome segregation ATPase
MTTLHIKIQSNLKTAQETVADLSTKLATSTEATEEVQRELLLSTDALSALTSRLDIQSERNAQLDSEIVRLDDIVQTKEAELAQASLDPERIIILEKELFEAQSQLSTALAAAISFNDTIITANELNEALTQELSTIRSELSITLSSLLAAEESLLASQTRYTQVAEAARMGKLTATASMTEVEARASRGIQTLRKLAKEAGSMNETLKTENGALEAGAYFLPLPAEFGSAESDNLKF